MKVFVNLEIHGHHALLERFINELGGVLNDGWSRNIEREEQIHVTVSENMFCFACTNSGERPAAQLWLAFRDDDILYVSNIVPQEIDQLNFDLYNLVLDEFYQKFSKPVADSLGLELVLTSSEKQLEDWMSVATAKKLQSFSSLANKSTGSSHPSDLQRWLIFIVSIHSEDTKFDSSLLYRWLTEDENWSSEIANTLSLEYEFGLSLLSFYDEN